jgi:hypothetical protein
MKYLKRNAKNIQIIDSTAKTGNSGHFSKSFDRDQLAINKKWIEEIADYNWEKNCMVYGEMRGIGIIERVYC